MNPPAAHTHIRTRVRVRVGGGMPGTGEDVILANAVGSKTGFLARVVFVFVFMPGKGVPVRLWRYRWRRVRRRRRRRIPIPWRRIVHVLRWLTVWLMMVVRV